MWDVTDKFKGNLPPGFRLKEDEDNAYLYYGKELVARFSSNGDPREIESAALDYKAPIAS